MPILTVPPSAVEIADLIGLRLSPEKARVVARRMAFHLDLRTAELEKTAGFLADCWIILDGYARGDKSFTPADARAILRKQKAPGWKDGG